MIQIGKWSRPRGRKGVIDVTIQKKFIYRRYDYKARYFPNDDGTEDLADIERDIQKNLGIQSPVRLIKGGKVVI